MNTMNPFFATDGYKTGHPWMYPQGTSLVYSNGTFRSLRHAPEGITTVTQFGPQMVMRTIHEMFNDNFFLTNNSNCNEVRKRIQENDKSAIPLLAYHRDKVCGEIKREYSMYLNTDFDVSHIEALFDLGYLPIKFKALPEGTTVGMGVPVLTIHNTKPEFYWLTNFLETLISNLIWKPMTSATIALQYKKILTKWALETDKNNIGFVEFQAHDFSMRGMDSIGATISSGLGHATSFMGSDSLPVIYGARKYYDEINAVVHSVNATEHSVMCAGEKGTELETFRYLMKQFPTGVLSIVSDTWDLWYVITVILPQLKDEILARDGKIVIRPDSGNPVEIICGKIVNFTNSKGIHFYDKNQDINNTDWEEVSEVESKGVIELLWDIFGGTVNDQGYKVLDPHIGAIYGDAITLERADTICKRLGVKGFASTNIVFGIGSFTYQYNTRDTFGFAMKATYVEITHVAKTTDKDSIPMLVSKVEGREIFKDPITDRGSKKSAKGLLQVINNNPNCNGGDWLYDGNDVYVLNQQVTWEQEAGGMLQIIYEDGVFKNKVTLTEIRARVNKLI